MNKHCSVFLWHSQDEDEGGSSEESDEYQPSDGDDEEVGDDSGEEEDSDEDYTSISEGSESGQSPAI